MNREKLSGMKQKKQRRFAFFAFILSAVHVFMIMTAPLFGADNNIKADFDKPAQLDERNLDKTPKKALSEKSYKGEIHLAFGFAILQAGDAVDKGDFYRADGRKIRLFRSLEKTALWQKNKEALNTDNVNSLLSKELALKLEEERSTKLTIILKASRRMTPMELDSILRDLRQSNQFQRVDPVFVNEETGKEMIVTSRIVVKLAQGVSGEQINDIHQIYGAQVIGHMHGAPDEIILDLGQAEGEKVLTISEAYSQDSRVLWASPNFLFQLDLSYIPNDPHYQNGNQWHLNNTGQSGGNSGADVDAPEAWDISTGNPDIVIAIIDTGVEITHPDLDDNIYTNEAEASGTPEVDDDANGYVDDINGWDFYDNDNDPNPGSTQGHGTCCAGVAAAEGDNAIGVAGIAYDCKILPVKICSDSGTFASSTAIGNAIRYAADMANVLSNSWGGGGDDSIIHSAIQYAVNTQKKTVFFASGNDADGTNSSPAWIHYTLMGFSDATYTFKWKYTKNQALSAGDDTVWLDDVTFPGGEFEGFEGDTFPPSGWSTGGDAGWTQYNESKHVRGTGTKSVKAGTITHNQTTYLQTTRAVSAGDLTYYAWVSSQKDLDIFQIEIVGSGNYLSHSGVPTVYYDVSYPARYPECIAVGASTDYDYRSQYSQYDETLDHVLDIVAPSNGGNWGIGTTDITGTGGYDSGDYTNPSGDSAFGGTSSACPLAAGVAALLLSENPNLTPNQIKEILENTADKIGDVTYADGYNKYYGYGRVNADAALALRISITVDPLTWSIGVVNMGETKETGSNYFTATNDGNVAEDFAIQSGDSANWTCGATEGNEIFAMKVQGGDQADWTALDTNQTLKTDVAVDDSVTFDLQFTAPTATVHVGTPQSIAVTVTASMH